MYSVYRFQLSVGESHFDNVLNANRFTMKTFAILLIKRITDIDTWIYQTYNVNMTFDYAWNILDVPAGLLQFPLYSENLPYYVRYGTIGVPIAMRLAHAIDVIGEFKWESTVN